MYKKNKNIGKLNNGLRYYIYNDSRNDNKIRFFLIVKTGSLDELDKQNGIAHVLEHINLAYDKYDNKYAIFLNKLTQKHIKDFKYKGYTDFDRTVYEIEFNNNIPEENIENGICLLSKIINGEMINEYILESVKQEVINEYIYYKKKTLRQLSLIKFITNNQIYSLPIGTVEDIEKLRFRDIINFYNKNYLPNRMSVMVIGNIDTTKTEMYMAKNLNYNKKKVNSRSIRRFENLDCNKLIVLDDGIYEYTKVKFYYKYTYDVLSIKDKLTKYLFEKMIQNYIENKCNLYKIPLEEVVFSEKIISHDYKFFVLSYTIDKLKNGVNTLIEIIDEFKKNGLKNNEFEIEKKRLINLLNEIKENGTSLEAEIIFEDFLKNFLYNEEITFVQEYYDKIVSEISIDEINTLMNMILNNYFRIVINPAKDEYYENSTLI